MTKSILLTDLRRWAATSSSIVLESRSGEQTIALTSESEQISQLIGGYIDIILKNESKEKPVVEKSATSVASVGSNAIFSRSSATMSAQIDAFFVDIASLRQSAELRLSIDRQQFISLVKRIVQNWTEVLKAAKEKRDLVPNGQKISSLITQLVNDCKSFARAGSFVSSESSIVY